MHLKLFVLFLIFQTIGQLNCQIIRNKDPLYSWHQIEYKLQQNSANTDDIVYPSYGGKSVKTQNSRNNVNLNNNNRNEDYVRYNNVPMGVTRWRDKLFITMPRRRPGIPGTLNYIELNDNERSNNIDIPLIPYPDLSINQLQKESKRGIVNLVSVYRTTADECNRLWMVDTGLLEYPGNPQRVQSAAIVVIDLLTNQLQHRYPVPDNVVRNTSTLASIAIDVIRPGRCDDTFAYIPDLAGYGLIVFDLRQQRFWRFNHNYFHQDPIGGEFHINNELHFQWNDGIFSIALSKIADDGFRTAFFHAMASTHEFSVSTRILRNESNSERSYHGNDFVHLGDKGRNQQTAMSVMDQQFGVLFYSQVHINGLACRNIYKPLSEQNFVLLFQNNEQFIYPSDITHDDKGNIWVMTNTMPYFIYSSLNPENINFRVWKFPVAKTIENTACAPPRRL